MAWRQTHELLRLEVPLAQAAIRWAADTSGGVITRPARACTPGEQMRWEVPVISWCATEVASPGGGLALLLDGPQGVDATPDRLGVSLVRGATWPDPGADRGWHRQRLALMPASQGWCRGGIPQAAIAFREPGWWGPAAPATAEQWLPPLPSGLVPVAVGAPRSSDRHGDRSSGLRMRVLNPGARRQLWCPQGWMVRRQGEAKKSAREEIVFRPGELVEVELTPRPEQGDQSS